MLAWPEDRRTRRTQGLPARPEDNGRPTGAQEEDKRRTAPRRTETGFVRQPQFWLQKKDANKKRDLRVLLTTVLMRCSKMTERAPRTTNRDRLMRPLSQACLRSNHKQPQLEACVSPFAALSATLFGKLKSPYVLVSHEGFPQELHLQQQYTNTSPRHQSYPD